MPWRYQPDDDPAGSSLMRIPGGPELSRAIIEFAHQNLSRVDFLREVSDALLRFLTCDALEIRLHEEGLQYRWQATKRPHKNNVITSVSWRTDGRGRVIPALRDDTDLEGICADVACQVLHSDSPFFSFNGSFWTGDAWESFSLGKQEAARAANDGLCIGGHFRSVAIIRFMINERNSGLLLIMNEEPHSFTESGIGLCEEVAQTLGLAITVRFGQTALRERLKELTCLYGIAQIIEDTGISIDQALQRIVELLPPSWQYSDIAAAKITLDQKSFSSFGFQSSQHIQSAGIIVGGTRRGQVEVAYFKDRPELGLGAFLIEEEKLIRAVAREIALFVERREAEEEKQRLGEQLIHADRLATIGQLAAGVAHELNEPLASILGFGQLARKQQGLAQQTQQDLDRIVDAALYAREVIKNLLVFSRQMPARKIPIDLNQVVEEGLYFLESRCAQTGIEVRRDLAEDLPKLVADPSQLKQVLVNLVVNAIQAMPKGGELLVRTGAEPKSVVLSVTDNGTGIPEDLLDKIFLPFFTTKEVDKGTGLGLAVVHGIVTTHGGSIKTQSQPGMGTTFEIHLPVQEAVGSREGAGHDA